METTFQLKVTATNIGPNDGGVVTPLWVSSHNGDFDSFDLGEAASTGIEALAEDGLVGLEGTVPGFLETIEALGGLDPAVVPAPEETLAGLFAASDAAADGGSQGILQASIAGLFPGESSSAFLALGENPGEQNRYFSFGAMFFPSNDAFIGNENPFEIDLFDAAGNFIGADIIVTGNQVWDAGTEVNDEDFTNIPITLDLVGNGTPEGGTVQAHPGFLPSGSGGVLDFTSPAFSFTNADFQTVNDQIIRITVEKVPVVDAFEFRAIDGSDNNGDKGATGEQLLRLFDNAYEDGVSTPRGGDFDESTLPNPRAISNTILDQTESVTNFLNVSDWVWQWGQFIDHDLDLNEASGNFPLEDFMPIEVPEGDPTFADGTAFPFIRVSAAPGTSTGPDNPRETINQITALIDASSVYGSDEERAEFLRDSATGPGLLKTSVGLNGEALLPLNDPANPQENATGGTGLPVEEQFVAGDVRANEQIGLTATHALFVREHNRIATDLYERLEAGETALTQQLETFSISHPLLSDEEALDDFIYESARKVVIAEVQAITYNEFLPILIGEDTLAEYAGYNPDINPQISTEFANAAYRLGHTMLNNQLRRVDGDGITETSLSEAFFSPEDIQENGIESLLTGLIFQGAQEVDNLLVDSVRDFLFPAGTGGFDLGSVNIARGRDVGLPSYTAIYEEIFGETINDFSDLGSEGLGLFSDAVVSLFEAAYDSVDQIDLWVGGISELPDEHGGLLGPTLSFFIADQFGRTRDGDEFFYLQAEELADLEILAPGITGVTLADVIRNNSDADYLVSDNVFEVPFEATISGDDNNNVLKGNNQDELIEGFGGNDRIRARSGDDIVFAGLGDDTVFGSNGDDKAFGSNGDDFLQGDSGKDTLIGGLGDDTLRGGSGNDVMDGQAGNDVYFGSSGRDTFVFGADLLNDGLSDVDTIQSFKSNDVFDFGDYLTAGGSIEFTRVSNGRLQIDLNSEDQINVFGRRAALNAAELQLEAL